jgi:hypothetical protein
MVMAVVISTSVSIPLISVYAFWIAVIGYAILVLGRVVKTAWIAKTFQN